MLARLRARKARKAETLYLARRAQIAAVRAAKQRESRIPPRR